MTDFDLDAINEAALQNAADKLRRDRERAARGPAVDGYVARRDPRPTMHDGWDAFSRPGVSRSLAQR